MSCGGEGGTTGIKIWLGRKHSEESKKKMSESQKNKKPATKETRERIRIALSKRIISDESKKKRSTSAKGNKNALGCKRSEFERLRISKLHKGKKLSDETKLKISEAGRNISDSTRLKMSESHKGIPWSEARRESQNNRYVNADVAP